LQGSNVPSSIKSYKQIHPSQDSDWVTLYPKKWRIIGSTSWDCIEDPVAIL
jgi:hypothetical protein